MATMATWLILRNSHANRLADPDAFVIPEGSRSEAATKGGQRKQRDPSAAYPVFLYD